MDQDLWKGVCAAITRSREPDGAHEAGERLAELWGACPTSEHALRCVIAHYAADLEDEGADELRWDRCALAEYALADVDDWHAMGIAQPAGMLASLHLNLGDGLHRAGDTPGAREQLAAAEAAVDALDADGYGAMIRRGVAGLRDRLDGMAKGSAAALRAPLSLK